MVMAKYTQGLRTGLPKSNGDNAPNILTSWPLTWPLFAMRTFEPCIVQILVRNKHNPDGVGSLTSAHAVNDCGFSLAVKT